MKYLLTLLFVAGLAVASSPELTGQLSGTGFGFPGTDDYLETYAYNAASALQTIPASFTDYRVVDDFVPAAGVNVTKWTNWFVTTAATPTTLNLMCFANNAGTPGTEVYQTPHAVTCVNSGFLFGSYVIYKAEMVLSQAFTAGTWWVGMHRVDGNNWYPNLGTVVTGSQAYRTQAAGYTWEPCSSSIGAADVFKIVEGIVTSLDRTTWGGIKNLF
jgi:hypothetical protein